MNNIIETVFAIEKCNPEIKLFGIYHISIFAISFILFHIMIHYQKINKTTEFLAKVSTLLVLLLHFILYAWYHFSPEHLLLKGLPLYTCRMTIYLFAIGIFFKKESCLKLACYWGCYGGIAGLIFPTIFQYPFPHILQISTVMLHVVIFLLSSYYLFVKKIGMTVKDSIKCCKLTTALIIFCSIINVIFGTNYISTLKMPAHLVNLGINLPDFLCLPAVILGYIAVTMFQCWVVNLYCGTPLKIKKSVKEEV